MNYVRKWNERKGFEKLLYEQHVYRINHAKPVIDTYQHTKIKPIPRYEIENRIQQSKIDIENMELLYRLAQTKTSIQTHNHVSVLRQLRLKQQIAHIERKLKQRNIDIENNRLLYAIQEVKPTISFEQIEKEYQKSREKVKLMSLYPEYIK